jgi:hypothetical protein
MSKRIIAAEKVCFPRSVSRQLIAILQIYFMCGSSPEKPSIESPSSCTHTLVVLQLDNHPPATISWGDTGMCFDMFTVHASFEDPAMVRARAIINPHANSVPAAKVLP